MYKVKSLKKQLNILVFLTFALFSLAIIITFKILSKLGIFHNDNYLKNEKIIIVTIIIIAAISIIIELILKNLLINNIIGNRKNGEKDIDELKIQNYIDIRKDNRYDLLTGRLNKKALENAVTDIIMKNPDTVGGMIFIDIDNIKYINDRYGHDVGDIFILRASENLDYFNEYNGIISRISGDEFVVYLHGYDNEEDLLNIFKNLYTYCDNFNIVTPDGIENKIRFTSGLAWYPKNGSNFEELYKFSDFALYEAKNKQKGSLFEFSQAYYDRKYFLVENSIAIAQLIDQKLIEFVYQPIVDLKTGEVYAYEALLRSKMPNFKSPYEIIKVATIQSKLPQLESLIVFSIYENIAKNKDIIGDKKIFLNSLANQALSVEDGNRLTEQYGEFYNKVVVEITEQENENIESMESKLAFCRNNGIQIAIDDFGNGFSNEVRVLLLEPDIIKIDMELIQGINKNLDKQSIVKNIVSFCKGKGIKVVAEGVEEKEDLECIISLNIDYVQGFYVARPEFNYIDISKEMKNEIVSLQKLNN